MTDVMEHKVARAATPDPAEAQHGRTQSRRKLSNRQDIPTAGSCNRQPPWVTGTQCSRDSRAGTRGEATDVLVRHFASGCYKSEVSIGLQRRIAATLDSVRFYHICAGFRNAKLVEVLRPGNSSDHIAIDRNDRVATRGIGKSEIRAEHVVARVAHTEWLADATPSVAWPTGCAVRGFSGVQLVGTGYNAFEPEVRPSVDLRCAKQCTAGVVI